VSDHDDLMSGNCSPEWARHIAPKVIAAKDREIAALQEQRRITYADYAMSVREIAALKEALARADGAIQKAAMSLGSTDEWTDQETMIADFEARIAALSGSPAPEKTITEQWLERFLQDDSGLPSLKGNGEG
jgi:hypothetical protein